MNEPRRWIDDEGLPSELGDVLREAPEPVPMSAESRGRGRRAVKRIAALPVGLAAWMGAKGALAAMGTLAAASATTFVALELREPEPIEVPEVVVKAETRGRPARARPVVPVVRQEAETEPEEPASDSEGNARRVPRAAFDPVAPGDRRDLSAESRLLEAARRRLPESPAAALAQCEAHRRAFPKGQLSSERTIIEIDALTRLGRSAEARRRADRFLARHPDGLYAERVRALVGRAAP